MKLTPELKNELCLKCMECCKHTLIPTPYTTYQSSEVTKEAVYFYKTKGFIVKVFSGRVFIHIQGNCPNLTKKGCKIYNVRPSGCVKYDGRLDPLLRDICFWNKVEKLS